ncbi:response regulator [Pseudobacteriovorax antillogorgiicola]|uniref:Hpt domain-containing protein n=1 Tax=Pseudobacteriovorax antillogorgiicola TaxID=1513793 RepID=A0A1Y6BI27_9BACT|nr:response regulator [Pseudobacteriovorax antillogorgiicola]TCS56494.1 Hpt domain-containing protein [Pseudobacteriovorax antillogorgiicola]SMF04813.1 Hpt domain-containing protein [Pseudobacteriovorax antillogorgiicola]
MSQVDIRREFIEEATELIEDCEVALTNLSKQSYNPEAVDRLFRDLHTVKGSAGVVGFSKLSEFVHAVEDAVNLYREQGKIPDQSLTILVEANDWIAFWLEKLADDMDYCPGDVELLDHLNMLKVKENIDLRVELKDNAPSFGTFEDEPSEDNQPTVMLVDDEPTMLQILETYLSDLPVNFVKANSAQEGLEQFNKNEVDVIVSDLRMPDMNGVDFITEVRKRDQKVEVVFFSAHANRQSLEQFIKLRTFAFIDKSESRIEILNTVANAVKTKRVADALACLTKLNFEIYLDFNLLRNGKPVEDRIQSKLEKVAKLTSIISDPELVLGMDLKRIA